MVTENTPTDDARTIACHSFCSGVDWNAPSIADCLNHFGVPQHLHREAERAFSRWLHSWDGLGETSESLQKGVRS